jgi:P-type conjugative transfer protein TrbJ
MLKHVFSLLLCSILGTNLALGTLPVFDAALNTTQDFNLTQSITSATQNVASVLKQVQQYETQLQQYETQIQQYQRQMVDAALMPQQIWQQAQGTMNQMMGLVNGVQNGPMVQYLQQYRSLGTWNAGGTGYVYSNSMPALSGASSLQLTTNNAALRLALQQRQDLINAANQLQQMQRGAQGAYGANQLLGSANQLAAAQMQQLLQMRLVLTQLLQGAATDSAAQANRQAIIDAATQQATSMTTGGFTPTTLPINYSGQ